MSGCREHKRLSLLLQTSSCYFCILLNLYSEYLTLRDVIFKIPTVNFWEIKIYQDICKEIHAIDICLLEVIFLVY